MAKNKKSSVKKGSRITPRKDARKLNRELMKDAFRIYDKFGELMMRFKAGYGEISEREDVPADALEAMGKFIDNNDGSFGDVVTLQDASALECEKLLDNINLKWTDIELEITGHHVEMQLRVEEWTAKFAACMAEAAELATRLPDEVPTSSSEALEHAVKHGTIKEVHDLIESGAVLNSVPESDVKKVEVVDGAVIAHGEDGEVSRLVSVDNETIEVDTSTVVLPKETTVTRKGAVAKVDASGELLPLPEETTVARKGAVAKVDADGELLPLA